MAERLNITYHGACPACGATVTVSGLGATDTPAARASLGRPTEGLRCVCDEAEVPMTCVGVAFAPFVAWEDRDDDD